MSGQVIWKNSRQIYPKGLADADNQRPDKWNSTVCNVVSEEYSAFHYADRELRAEVVQPNVPQHRLSYNHKRYVINFFDKLVT